MKENIRLLREALDLLAGADNKEAVELLKGLLVNLQRQSDYYSNPDYAVWQAHNRNETM